MSDQQDEFAEEVQQEPEVEEPTEEEKQMTEEFTQGDQEETASTSEESLVSDPTDEEEPMTEEFTQGDQGEATPTTEEHTEPTGEEEQMTEEFTQGDEEEATPTTEEPTAGEETTTAARDAGETTAGETLAEETTAGEKPAGESTPEDTAREYSEEETTKERKKKVRKEGKIRTEVKQIAHAIPSKSPTHSRPHSPASQYSEGHPYRSGVGKASPTITEEPEEMSGRVPTAPHLPSPERTSTTLEGTMSSSALNIVWSFGLNRNVPILNLTDGFRKAIFYSCSHVGVMHDFDNNKQYILQGHLNPITCTCVSEDKRWLVTGEKGPDAMVNVWDTFTGVPIQTLFDPNPEGGVIAVALTPDARYLATLSAGDIQVLAIWDWTVDGEMPICSADLKPAYGVQSYIHFNSQDVHHLVTNSESQVLFFHWEERLIQYYAPHLTDSDFNKPVGRYSQSIYQSNSSRALTGTSIGNLVVWDNNKPLTKVVSTEQCGDKKALKIIKVQERGINVLTTTDRYIVIGDQAGHVKFFDQSLKLIYWYQDLHLGPITSVSFATDPNNLSIVREDTNYPLDATIPAPKFVIRDFVVGTSIAVIGNVTTNGSKVQLIQREHDAAMHALAAHPNQPFVAMGSYSGLLKIWNYKTKEVMASRVFDRGGFIQTCAYDPKGAFLVVGFTDGSVHVLDAVTLQDEIDEPFHFAHDTITQIVFSHDSQFFATADAQYTTSLFRAQRVKEGSPFLYLGRYRAHYKPIRDLLFGVHLDTNKPRLLSLGADRVLVEYDLEKTKKDLIVLASADRIEQSGIPCCMALYPPITKEHFIVTANDQFKLKLYNATTKMCRKTLLGPTYGTPLQKLMLVPSKGNSEHYYCAYITQDKVGVVIVPLDGNPHNSMALIAHPRGVSNMVVSHDGHYIFTAGGADATVHMWEINISALEAQAKLGGEGLIPFYGLMEGGREGELFAELEDYFYYAQIRSQGVNATEKRIVSTSIPITEVPFIMRALGFYPTEQEIEDMINEVKFSSYVDTGKYVEELDLGTFIRLYVNHRPAFGLSPAKLQWAFDILGTPTPAGAAIDRGELLDMLQNRGEHMTEYELAEYMTTLLGYNPEGGSSELHNFDASDAANLIDQSLSVQITAPMFAKDILGFSVFEDSTTQQLAQ